MSRNLEEEVIALYAHGWRDEEIAEELRITTEEVSDICIKARADGRLRAAVNAVEAADA